jgi:HlyD family secretion protein
VPVLAERTQPTKEGSLAERSQRRSPTAQNEWNGPKTVWEERTQFVPPDFRLIPGMTATAEIVIGKRTVISYLLDPIVRLFDESLREP